MLYTSLNIDTAWRWVWTVNKTCRSAFCIQGFIEFRYKTSAQNVFGYLWVRETRHGEGSTLLTGVNKIAFTRVRWKWINSERRRLGKVSVWRHVIYNLETCYRGYWVCLLLGKCWIVSNFHVNLSLWRVSDLLLPAVASRAFGGGNLASSAGSGRTSGHPVRRPSEQSWGRYWCGVVYSHVGTGTACLRDIDAGVLRGAHDAHHSAIRSHWPEAPTIQAPSRS